MKQQKNTRGHVKSVAICAILAVMGFVLDRFVGISIPLFGMTSLMINISYVPIFMAGILYGPVWGALVGGVQDILCLILVPLGPPIWGITATTMLAGAMAGFFGRFVLKINSSNRSDLIIPTAEDRSKTKAFYICALIFIGVYTSILFSSAMKFTVGETVHDLSVWEILFNSTEYKNAFIEITSLYSTENLPEAFYSWNMLSDIFGSVSVLFVLALPLTVIAIYFSHKKKNFTAIISELFAFVCAGFALIMIIDIPKKLKELPVTFQYGASAIIAPIVCCAVLIVLLMETDAVKFKLATFCGITSLTTSVLNSFWLSQAYEKGVMVYLPIRLATSLTISTPIYAFLLYYLLVKAKWLKKMI